MSEQMFQATVDLRVKDHTTSIHSMFDLALMALSLESVHVAVSGAEKSMANHWFDHAQRCEREARAITKTTFKAVGVIGMQVHISSGEDVRAISMANTLFRKEVGDTIQRLVTEKGWQGEKLPKSADQAVRKIIAGFEKGFSMLTFTSCEAVAKATSKRNKELEADEDRKNLEAAGKGVNAAQSAGNGEMTGVPEVDAVLAQIIESAKVASQKDSKSVLSSLNAYNQKIGDMAKRLSGALANAAA